MKGLEPSQINLLEPKPSASTNSATSTRWSKRDIPHKDITEAYPLSYHGILVYLSSASGNRHTWIRTRNKGLEDPCDIPFTICPRDLPVCASMRGMEGERLTQGLDPCCSYDYCTTPLCSCQAMERIISFLLQVFYTLQNDIKLYLELSLSTVAKVL